MSVAHLRNPVRFLDRKNIKLPVTTKSHPHAHAKATDVSHCRNKSVNAIDWLEVKRKVLTAYFSKIVNVCDLARATIFAPLGRARRTLRDLLNTKKGIKLLFRYVNATRRFQRTFGTLQDLPDDFDEDDTPGAAAQRTRTHGRRQGT